MLIHFPSDPINDITLPGRGGPELRDIIKTCAANGIQFKLIYDYGHDFRYITDPGRRSR
jgi:hypothetical protein